MKNFTPARQELKKRGWKRQDRRGQELWQLPWNGIGYQPNLVTFQTACRKERIKIVSQYEEIMSKGRTAWEILTQKQVSIVDTIVNPLSAKVGSHVAINCSLSDVELSSNELWKITEIWSWNRNINDNQHPMTDYVIESDEKRLVIRVLPRADHGYHVLAMSQYYPEMPGPMLWNDESPYLLEAANDPTGEFYKNKGQDNEEKYWRIGGNVPIHCDVQILRDLNQDGAVADGEVAQEPYTLWDYHRVTTGDVGQELTQYLYIQLSGKYKQQDGRNPTIAGGDKTILILRGEELEPSCVTIF